MAGHADSSSLPGGKLLEDGDLVFRTKTVEEALAPLIEQVTTLSEYKTTKGRLKKPHKVSKLVQIVGKATKNFVTVGEEIANENPEFQEKLLLACEEVRAAGEVMHKAASEFAADTLQTEKRDVMVHASQELLKAVTRLMVIADTVDVSKLLKATSRIEEKLQGLRAAKDEEDLMNKIRECAPEIANVTQLATLRQNDLKSEASQQLLAAAQTELNQASRMLISSSKAFLQHRDVASAEENRDYVITRMLETLKTISLLADGEDPDDLEYGIGKVTPGNLAVMFSQFEDALDQSALAATATSDPSVHYTQLQKRMEQIILTTAEIADSEGTRDYRQHSLISQCGDMKEKVQKLLAALKGISDDRSGGGGVEGLGGEGDWGVVISECVTDVGEKIAEFQKELRRAMVDHVSDAFVDVTSPVALLCEAAQAGDTQLVEERAATFIEHAKQLEKVAVLACSLSLDTEGIRMVRVATKYVRTLRPQVVNAARTLAARPDSYIAQKNMAVFRETWVENVALLTDTVDAIVPLNDFMAITEAHIREDSQQFLQAVENCDDHTLRQTISAIRERCSHLVRVVRADTGAGRYGHDSVQQVEGAMQKLMDKSLTWFCDLASKAADTLHSSHDPRRVNTQVLEEALQKVADDVRDVRRTVLMARTPNELEGESDLEELFYPPPPISPAQSLLSQLSDEPSTIATPARKFQRTPRHSMVFDAEDTTRAVMAQLPAEQQAKLAKEAEGLSAEHEKLEKEVKKWDTSHNDIVVLAKEMCIMMMDMSDFARGLGHLRTTMDVIITAKDIARAGEILDEQARIIADQALYPGLLTPALLATNTGVRRPGYEAKCPDQQCRKDLVAYLDRIQLYCKQLKITSAVKADLKTSTRDTVDNASALIAAAKNLMTAVVLAVKACYVASSVIARMGGDIPEQVLQWRLTAPRKKRLYQEPTSEKAAESWRDTLKSPHSMSHIHQLGEFKPGRHEQQRVYVNVGIKNGIHDHSSDQKNSTATHTHEQHRNHEGHTDKETL